jgi:hypothetical protein
MRASCLESVESRVKVFCEHRAQAVEYIQKGGGDPATSTVSTAPSAAAMSYLRQLCLGIGPQFVRRDGIKQKKNKQTNKGGQILNDVPLQNRTRPRGRKGWRIGNTSNSKSGRPLFDSRSGDRPCCPAIFVILVESFQAASFQIRSSSLTVYIIHPPDNVPSGYRLRGCITRAMETFPN